MTKKTIKAIESGCNSTEHDIQVTLFQNLELWVTRGGDPKLLRLYATPNGEHRTDSVAARLKAEGVKAGVLDLFLPVPIGFIGKIKYSGFYLEMKKPGGKFTLEQSEFAEKAWKDGYYVGIYFDWDPALRALKLYLRGHESLPEFVLWPHSLKNWRKRLEEKRLKDAINERRGSGRRR